MNSSAPQAAIASDPAAFGFTVPAGDPEALGRAAIRADTEADLWGTAAQTVRGAARTAQGGWQGSAQTAFGTLAEQTAAAHDDNGAALRQAAQALQSLSASLDTAQRITRQAAQSCAQAQGRLTLAQRQSGPGAARTTAAARADLQQAVALGRRAAGDYATESAAATRRIQAAADQLRGVPSAGGPVLTVGPGGVLHPGPVRVDTLPSSGASGRKSDLIVAHAYHLSAGAVRVIAMSGRQYTFHQDPETGADVDTLKTVLSEVLSNRAGLNGRSYYWVYSLPDSPGRPGLVSYQPRAADPKLPRVNSALLFSEAEPLDVDRGSDDGIDTSAMTTAALQASRDGAGEVVLKLDDTPDQDGLIDALNATARALAARGVAVRVTIVVPADDGTYEEAWTSMLGAGPGAQSNVYDLQEGEFWAENDQGDDPDAGELDPGDPDSGPEPSGPDGGDDGGDGGVEAPPP